ncbi:PbsX family transcriptional regulator [Polynucleobacter sp. AP-Melu-500A-A1]|jgi:antitoxin MazE|uniref:AbrB/MazE/SpoVT family DNA-binding domain-containing protein n=1 Tax=Polynucleobacter sp. AP-Melu-500A-A1 TaxID=2576929 RepID=UPI001C0C4AA8|nr:PbsX family transcriptional regulator [Polynucleobacter sp. AP-Melu-500A-A1]MBU3631667.1 PbsX family transcriptional regulator [Polynucleobacter sp. AP-Melu-500A-A1]
MSPALKVEQIVQEWGNGLGVRITSPVAKAAHLSQGVPISVEVVKNGVLLRVVGKPKLSLNQKLKAFDPENHSGEVMATTAMGKEII